MAHWNSFHSGNCFKTENLVHGKNNHTGRYCKKRKRCLQKTWSKLEKKMWQEIEKPKKDSPTTARYFNHEGKWADNVTILILSQIKYYSFSALIIIAEFLCCIIKFDLQVPLRSLLLCGSKFQKLCHCYQNATQFQHEWWEEYLYLWNVVPMFPQWMVPSSRYLVVTTLNQVSLLYFNVAGCANVFTVGTASHAPRLNLITWKLLTNKLMRSKQPSKTSTIGVQCICLTFYILYFPMLHFYYWNDTIAMLSVHASQQ